MIQVTRQTLEAGASILGIKVPRGASDLEVEQLIIQHMIKHDMNFGRFACEGCGKDTGTTITSCPFCGSEFLPDLADQAKRAAPQEEDPWADTWEEEDVPAVQSATQPAPTPQPVTTAEVVQPVKRKRGRPRKAAKAVEVPEQPVKRKRGRPKGSVAVKKTDKRSRAAAKLKREQKARELEQKREQVQKGLPYSADQLQKMKRTTLIMVAGVMGIKNPMKLGSATNIANHILQAQQEKFGR